MNEQDVFTCKAQDNISFYDYDLLEALSDATNGASEADGESAHYVHTEDGRMVESIRVSVETLSDGSKVSTIYLKLTRA